MTLRPPLVPWFAFACAALGPGACARSRPPEAPAPERAARNAPDAWWLTARFVPADTAVAGLSVGRIDSTWTRAVALSRQAMPDSAAADRRQLNARNLGFERSGDFNGDGRPDRALVGAYETRSGEHGRFLLVLTRTPAGTWEKAFVSEEPGVAGFSILWQSATGLAWMFCLECDDGALLRWQQDRYALVPLLEHGP